MYIDNNMYKLTIYIFHNLDNVIVTVKSFICNRIPPPSTPSPIANQA